MNEKNISLNSMQLRNIVSNMKCEGFVVSQKTQNSCMAVLNGKASAKQEVAKSVAKYSRLS